MQVGADVARRAKGLGMNVIAHDPYAAEEKARALNVRLVTFQEAVETADFLSLHMPLTPGVCTAFLPAQLSPLTQTSLYHAHSTTQR